MGLVCFAQDNILLRFINVPSSDFSEFSLQIQVHGASGYNAIEILFVIETMFIKSNYCDSTFSVYTINLHSQNKSSL